MKYVIQILDIRTNELLMEEDIKVSSMEEAVNQFLGENKETGVLLASRGLIIVSNNKDKGRVSI